MADQENYWRGVLKRKRSRRAFLGMAAGLGVGYAGLSLVGCGGDKASPKPSADSAAKSPKYGGILNWFDPGSVPDIDPFDRTKGGVAQRGARGIIFERLVDYDWSGDLTTSDLKFIPKLAESWTMNDPTTYVFKLRQNVKWHDGVEFTAADVKYSYEFMLDPQNAVAGRSALTNIDKMEAVDKFTIKFTTKKPQAAFISLLADEEVLVGPKHLLEKSRANLAANPVGTGAFMVDKLDPKTGVTYKKNPNYYIPGRPYLNGMNQLLIQDWSAKAAAFMSKEIDVYIVTDKPQYEAVKAVVPDAQLRAWPGININSFAFNMTRPPFNDIRVRRAVQLAVDHKGLLDRIWSGEGAINPPVIAGMLKSWAIPQEELLKIPGWRQPKDQDIAEAKRLLAEAGYANGLKVTALCDSTLSTTPKNLQVVSEHLRAVGITVSQECSEPAITNKRVNATDFDFYLVPYGAVADDPSRRLLLYAHSKGSNNKGKLSDPKLDAMIEKDSETLNQEERKKMVLDIQRYLIDNAYLTPTPDPYYYGIMHSYVRGYDPAYMGSPHPHPRGEVQDIWLDK